MLYPQQMTIGGSYDRQLVSYKVNQSRTVHVRDEQTIQLTLVSYKVYFTAECIIFVCKRLQKDLRFIKIKMNRVMICISAAHRRKHMQLIYAFENICN